MTDKRVKNVVFVSKEDNLHDLAVSQGWDVRALRYLQNPLPDCLKVEVALPEDLPEVAKVAKGIKGVADAHYAQEVTLRLLSLIRGAKITGLVLIIVLALTSLGIIGTTIRLTIYARRREIRVMQLVGATNWFIRLPFLMEGAVCGLAGGLLAMTLLMIGYSYLEDQASKSLPFMTLIYGPRPLALLAALMVVGGVLFGVAGSLIATREYLKEV
jgi:cell division transport system permease protein